MLKWFFVFVCLFFLIGESGKLACSNRGYALQSLYFPSFLYYVKSLSDHCCSLEVVYFSPVGFCTDWWSAVEQVTWWLAGLVRCSLTTDFGVILCLLRPNAGVADFLFFYTFIKKEKVGNCIAKFPGLCWTCVVCYSSVLVMLWLLVFPTTGKDNSWSPATEAPAVQYCLCWTFVSFIDEIKPAFPTVNKWFCWIK